MSASPVQSSLRLVRSDDDARGRAPGRAASSGLRISDPPAHRPMPRAITGSERIEHENTAASSISALDPRWVMAVEVYREMQGGRAAIVTPDTRRRLMLVGRRLGLRVFDTSLIIAIIQDGARRGEDPLGPMSVSRLRLVHDSELADARPVLTWSRVAAMVFAAGLFGAAVTLMAVGGLG